MNYSIHPEAEAELGDAAMYYATHASGMIALAFLAEYERVRDLLIENQRRGPRGEDLKSSPSRIRAVNPDTGMTESELLKRDEEKAMALFRLADRQRAMTVDCG